MQISKRTQSTQKVNCPIFCHLKKKIIVTFIRLK